MSGEKEGRVKEGGSGEGDGRYTRETGAMNRLREGEEREKDREDQVKTLMGGGCAEREEQ